jgi:hypothetical protein
VPSDGGLVGAAQDGVRILWTSFGLNSPIGPAYNLGRTTPHEVGHYLGLSHTFQGGSSSTSGCTSNGDLICDTNPESSPNDSPCSRSSCGSVDPTHHDLNDSDEICMFEFNEKQSRRMRCTMDDFRVDLAAGSGPVNSAPTVSLGAPSCGLSVVDGSVIAFSASGSGGKGGNLSSAISWWSNLDGFLGNGSLINPTLSVGSHTVTAQVSDAGGLSDTDAVSVTSIGGGGLSLTTNGYKVKGRVTVDLSWSGANTSSVEIWRDGNLLTTTANDGAYTDVTGLKGAGSLAYQVCETGGGSVRTRRCSLTDPDDLRFSGPRGRPKGRSRGPLCMTSGPESLCFVAMGFCGLKTPPQRWFRSR